MLPQTNRTAATNSSNTTPSAVNDGITSILFIKSVSLISAPDASSMMLGTIIRAVFKIVVNRYSAARATMIVPYEAATANPDERTNVEMKSPIVVWSAR
jgi:hypothetical protein